MYTSDLCRGIRINLNYHVSGQCIGDLNFSISLCSGGHPVAHELMLANVKQQFFLSGEIPTSSTFYGVFL